MRLTELRPQKGQEIPENSFGKHLPLPQRAGRQKGWDRVGGARGHAALSEVAWVHVGSLAKKVNLLRGKTEVSGQSLIGGNLWRSWKKPQH